VGKRIAALDGDGFLYRIAASMEKVKYGVFTPKGFTEFGSAKEARECRDNSHNVSPHVWTRREVGTLDEAIARLRMAVNKAMMLTEASELLFIVSGPRNFRDQIGTIRKYKGNRDSTARPILLGDLREWAGNEYDGFMESDNMESDDVISIMMTDNEDVIAVSNDKDLKQVPGHHVNWVTEIREYIDTDSASRNLYKQILTGDPGDNIVGCWGVGPQTASELVKEWKEGGLNEQMMWSYIVEEYEKSKKLKDCPYVDIAAEDVAEEMFLLVHLLEYKEEAEDILRAKLWLSNENQNNSKESKTNGKESHQEGSTSGFVQIAEARE